MRGIVYRLPSWLALSLLRAVCVLRGHDYDLHWTRLGLMRPDEDEQPWCGRCGGDPR